MRAFIFAALLATPIPTTAQPTPAQLAAQLRTHGLIVLKCVQTRCIELDTGMVSELSTEVDGLYVMPQAGQTVSDQAFELIEQLQRELAD